jgi:hypothetical protein
VCPRERIRAGTIAATQIAPSVSKIREPRFARMF